MSISQFFQQGDVLIFDVVELPTDAIAQESRVVQEGEHTGHAHRLDAGEVLVHEGIKYLRLLEPTTIRHEEHAPIKLPRGNYQIGIVREYDHFSEEARAVAD